MRRIVVFGAGALGSVLGGRLARVAPVALVGRAAHMAAIRAEGLRLEGLAHELVRCGERLTAVEELAELPGGLRAGDLVLLTVKAAQTGAAGRALAAALPKGRRVPVVALQNGTGFEDGLRAALGDRAELCFAVSHRGATLAAPGRVEDWGGEVLLPARPELRGLAEALRAAGIEGRAVADLEARRWEKIAFNCALNAFCVLLDARNNETLDPAWRPLRRAVLEEARAEARCAGVELRPLEELAAEFERRVAASRNVNSMLQDFRQGRPTENPYLNGALARAAAARGACAPANAALAEAVTRLEAARGGPELPAVRAELRAALRAWRPPEAQP